MPQAANARTRDRRRPRSQLVLSFLLRGGNAAGQLLLSFIVLQAFGSAALGVFTVVVSNSMLITLLTRRGYDRTLILFQARESVRRFAPRLFWRYAQVVLTVSPFAALVNVALYWGWVGRPESLMCWTSLAVLPAALALSALAGGYFSGGGRSAAAMIQQPGFAMGIASLVIGGGLLAGLRLPPIPTFTAAACLVAIVGLARVSRDGGDAWSAAWRRRVDVPSHLARLADRQSRGYLVINFFTTFSSVFFFSYLALFVSALEIGQFRGAERLAQLLAFNLTFINVVLPGTAIRAYHDRDFDAFARHMSRVFQFQWVTTAALFIALVVFRQPLMRWLEIPSLDELLLPLFAQFVNAVTGPVRVLLMYLGANATLQTSVIIEALASAVLYWTLYAAMGLKGISIAYFLAIAVPNVVLAGIVYRRFGVLPLPWVRLRPMTAGAA